VHSFSTATVHDKVIKLIKYTHLIECWSITSIEKHTSGVEKYIIFIAAEKRSHFGSIGNKTRGNMK
jgi:hypothetical protein